MRLPKMSDTEKAVFAAAFAREMGRHQPATDNSNAEFALDAALWEVECFRQAVRERKR